MTKRLSWIDVLNQQSTWHSRADLLDWFSNLIGRRASLLEGSIEGFEEALGFMRRQVANLHFGEPVDLLWLDTQLKTVNLGLLHHQGAQPGDEAVLPRFRVRVKGLLDSDLLRAVKDTLLIQFAEFVGTVLDDEGAMPIVRCQGLYGTDSVRQVAQNATYPAETETRWREEIPMLTRDESTTVIRCNDFIAAAAKEKYCSDACKFTTMQITKQTQETSYTGEKRRYRKRQSKTTLKNEV